MYSDPHRGSEILDGHSLASVELGLQCGIRSHVIGVAEDGGSCGLGELQPMPSDIERPATSTFIWMDTLASVLGASTGSNGPPSAELGR